MKLNIILFIGSGLLVLAACEPEDDMFRQFFIRKGEHYSSAHVIQSLQSNSLRFEAKFDASAQYLFRDEGFQDSKNKLLGFADCNSLHHENSARFGWQWYNNQLEIYAYCYVNSQRVEKFIGIVKLNEVNLYELFITEDSYIFQLNQGSPVAIERGSVCSTGVYYMLWPYFGGTLPAPHDVTIAVKIIS